MSGSAASSARVARIVRRCLERGGSVEIDGLGTFRPGESGGFEFVAQARPTVFLAYVAEDAPAVERLYECLRARGFAPWMDRRKLLPGQNWPRAIERAIRVSDYFVPCFSRRAVVKRGTFQSELRYALDCATRVPLDAIFLLPARLEECEVPACIQQEIQYVDLFPDWDGGFARLAGAIRRHERTLRKPLLRKLR